MLPRSPALRSPNTPLEGLVEDYSDSPSADCQQFIGLEDKAGSITELRLFIPRRGLSRTVEPSCPGDSTRRLILDHERRTEPRLTGLRIQNSLA